MATFCILIGKCKLIWFIKRFSCCYSFFLFCTDFPPASVLMAYFPVLHWPLQSLVSCFSHRISPFAHHSFTLSWFLLMTWCYILTCEDLGSTDEREAVRFVSQSNILWFAFNLIFSRTIYLHSNVISLFELNNIL